MNTRSLLRGSLALVAAALLLPAAASAAPRAYQVTGPVLELTESLIVVQKNDERWEIARTPETKVTGELKVGSKVTIEYTMSAKSVEVKAADKK
jgi:hypothetical protein